MDFSQRNTFFRATLIVIALLFAVPVFAQVSIGIRIGPPPAPRVVAFRPASPGPDFIWVEGYWSPVGSHYQWHDGYWSRPPYLGARWVAPRHDGERFFEGYWDGEHGRVDHSHPWTAERERYFREHEHDRNVREREIRERNEVREHNNDRDRDHDRGNHYGERKHEADHDR